MKLSALVRLRDEEVWCALSLASIVDWCDEVVVVTNTCTDRTPEFMADFAAEHTNVKVYDYPHRIWPMGPGHDAVKADDPRASASLYNFTVAQATGTHHLKWDGDMVAMDWLGTDLRQLLAEGHDRIKFEGIDIVGDALRHVGCHPRCPTNGVYRATPQTRYAQGPMTQNLLGLTGVPAYVIPRPAFLHFKWARKPFESATAQWPDNWQDIEHFRQIAARRHPVAEYTGEYPSIVRALL